MEPYQYAYNDWEAVYNNADNQIYREKCCIKQREEKLKVKIAGNYTLLYIK